MTFYNGLTLGTNTRWIYVTGFKVQKTNIQVWT